MAETRGRPPLSALDELAIAILRRDPIVVEVARTLPAGIALIERSEGIPRNETLRRAERMFTAAAREALAYWLLDPAVQPPVVDVEPTAQLTSAQVADLLGWSQRRVIRRAGELGGWQVGRPWFFDRATVEVAAIEHGWAMTDDGQSVGHDGDTCARSVA